MIEYKNIIKKPPLPFKGQKRYAVKHLYALFKDITLNKEIIIIDLFGGSGLLANFFKQMYPENRVIWNDYDDYNSRLKMIDITENIRCELWNILELEFGKKLTIREKKDIKIYLENKKEKLDYKSIYSWFSFNLREDLYWNKLPKFPINNIEGYLKDVERISEDFENTLFKFKNNDNILWICDPPYLQTYQNSYKSSFEEKQALILLENLKKQNNVLLFSSTNTSWINLIEKQKFITQYNKLKFQSALKQMNNKDEILFYKITI